MLEKGGRGVQYKQTERQRCESNVAPTVTSGLVHGSAGGGLVLETW